MAQTLWKSVAFMGLCFVLLAIVLEVIQWATAR